MPPVEGVTNLSERKRELLLVSDLNRKVLQIELGRWQIKADQWEARVSTARKWLLVLSPLMALLRLKRSPREPSSWFSRMFGFLKIFGK